MPPRMPLSARFAAAPTTLSRFYRYHTPQHLKGFASTASRLADDPASDLASILSPAKTTISSTSSTYSGSRNPASDLPNALSATKPVNAPSSSPKASDSSDRGSTSNSTSSLTQILRRRLPSSSAEDRRRQAENTAAIFRHRSNVENKMTRIWREGDIYAPHDLSPEEMKKARNARSNPRTRAGSLPLNSRRRGGKDIIDVLGINPKAEYKNVAMMSEYVSELGRIKHSRETGLRAVNQRKISKAIRRAIGIGLMPSVHRHPELHGERMSRRGQAPPLKPFF